jgi:hypothetical protein
MRPATELSRLSYIRDGAATSTAITVQEALDTLAVGCWAFVTVAGAVPTLQTGHNIESITDTATGRLLVTLTTGFADTEWAALVTGGFDTTSGTAERLTQYHSGTKAADSIELQCRLVTAGDGVFADPDEWSFIGIGA